MRRARHDGRRTVSQLVVLLATIGQQVYSILTDEGKIRIEHTATGLSYHFKRQKY